MELRFCHIRRWRPAAVQRAPAARRLTPEPTSSNVAAIADF